MEIIPSLYRTKSALSLVRVQTITLAMKRDTLGCDHPDFKATADRRDASMDQAMRYGFDKDEVIQSVRDGEDINQLSRHMEKQMRYRFLGK